MANEIERDWTTKAGYRAVALVVIWNGKRSHRCGYVGLPLGHPLYGVEYSQQVECLRETARNATLGKKSPILAFTARVGADEGESVRCSPDVAFDVHGGLTYSGEGRCHPAGGDEWWFGFDCAHSGDGYIEDVLGFSMGGVVRSLDYVVGECESLAEQIRAATEAAGGSDGTE